MLNFVFLCLLLLLEPTYKMVYQWLSGASIKR